MISSCVNKLTSPLFPKPMKTERFDDLKDIINIATSYSDQIVHLLLLLERENKGLQKTVTNLT